MAESTKVGGAYVEVQADVSTFVSNLNTAEDKFKSFAMSLQGETFLVEEAMRDMSKGSKESFEAISADAKKYSKDIDKARKASDNFAQTIAKNATTAETAGGRIFNSMDSIGRQASKLLGVFGRLGGVVAALTGLFTAFLRIGNEIEKVLNAKAIAAEKDAEAIKKLADETTRLVGEARKVQRTVEDAAVANAVKPYVEQLATLYEKLADPKLSSEVRDAIIEQARNAATLRNETEDKVRKEFADRRAAEDAKAAQERADTETRIQKERLDEYQRYADQIGEALLDQRTLLEYEFFKRRRELEEKGFTNLLEDLERERQKRLKDLDEMEEAKRRADAEQAERDRERHEAELRRISERAAAERAANANRFGGLNLAAGSSGDAVRLLRKIEYRSRTARFFNIGG